MLEYAGKIYQVYRKDYLLSSYIFFLNKPILIVIMHVKVVRQDYHKINTTISIFYLINILSGNLIKILENQLIKIKLSFYRYTRYNHFFIFIISSVNY